MKPIIHLIAYCLSLLLASSIILGTLIFAFGFDLNFPEIDTLKSSERLYSLNVESGSMQHVLLLSKTEQPPALEKALERFEYSEYPCFTIEYPSFSIQTTNHQGEHLSGTAMFSVRSACSDDARFTFSLIDQRLASGDIFVGTQSSYGPFLRNLLITFLFVLLLSLVFYFAYLKVCSRKRD